MGFAKFMASAAGRGLRIVAGIALVIAGFVWVTGVWGIVLAAVGVVVFLAGLLNFCLFAPIFGAPLSGAKLN